MNPHLKSLGRRGPGRQISRYKRPEWGEWAWLDSCASLRASVVGTPLWPRDAPWPRGVQKFPCPTPSGLLLLKEFFFSPILMCSLNNLSEPSGSRLLSVWSLQQAVSHLPQPMPSLSAPMPQPFHGEMAWSSPFIVSLAHFLGPRLVHTTLILVHSRLWGLVTDNECIDLARRLHARLHHYFILRKLMRIN